jgi:TDG/mug DNA glycosylase family protein
LKARIIAASPRILAFTSLTGGRRAMGASATFGLQDATIGKTKVWILPSPSPAAHWNWNEQIWRDLGEEFKALK